MRPVAPRALAFLAQRLEAPEGRTIAALLDGDDLSAFRLLTDAGAMVPASGPPPAVLCPGCDQYDVEPERFGTGLRALCPECGYVPIDNASLQVWVPSPDWLLGRMRQALGIAFRQDSTELFDRSVWKVGDAVAGRKRRRILFARRLGDVRVRSALTEILNRQVESDSGIVIGSTSRELAGWGETFLPYVHLAEMFRWRGGGLELDDSLWDWCLKPPHLRRHVASSVFFEGYRSAIIDGEEYTFGTKQARFWEFLHAAKGSKSHKENILQYVESNQDGPRELFRHNPRQKEVFRKLVDFDDDGFYWLTRD